MLTPMAVAFSTLIDEHRVLEEEGELQDYTTSLSFIYDEDRDVVGIDAQFEPDISQYSNLVEMPDSFQMMNLLVMNFLEGVGALNEAGELDESMVDKDLPTPRKLH